MDKHASIEFFPDEIVTIVPSRNHKFGGVRVGYHKGVVLVYLALKIFFSFALDNDKRDSINQQQHCSILIKHLKNVWPARFESFTDAERIILI
jgi:hypothetical protein